MRRWCRANFLSQPTLERLDSLREQFRQQLAEVGFTASAVPSGRASGRDAAAGVGSSSGVGGGSRQRGRDGEGSGRAAGATPAWEESGGPGPQDPDLNAGNLALVQSVIVAGLYPHVAAFARPDPKRQVRLCFSLLRAGLEGKRAPCCWATRNCIEWRGALKIRYSISNRGGCVDVFVRIFYVCSWVVPRCYGIPCTAAVLDATAVRRVWRDSDGINASSYFVSPRLLSILFFSFVAALVLSFCHRAPPWV